jgi:hypothetical protein
MVLSFSWRGPRPSCEDDVLAVNTGTCVPFFVGKGPAHRRRKGVLPAR